jgi:hypothetical protein
LSPRKWCHTPRMSTPSAVLPVQHLTVWITNGRGPRCCHFSPLSHVSSRHRVASRAGGAQEERSARGLVSLLVGNGDALAMRPGLLGDWDGVGNAFDGCGYWNRTGMDARAGRLISA